MSGFRCVHGVELHKQCLPCELAAKGEAGKAQGPTMVAGSRPHRLGAILQRQAPLRRLYDDLTLDAARLLIKLPPAMRGQAMKAITAMTEIHDTLSGHSWDADTIQEVAEILNRYGWPVAEPIEFDPDGVEVTCADGSKEIVDRDELQAAADLFDRMKGERR